MQESRCNTNEDQSFVLPVYCEEVLLGLLCSTCSILPESHFLLILCIIMTPCCLARSTARFMYCHRHLHLWRSCQCGCNLGCGHYCFTVTLDSVPSSRKIQHEWQRARPKNNLSPFLFWLLLQNPLSDHWTEPCCSKRMSNKDTSVSEQKHSQKLLVFGPAGAT